MSQYLKPDSELGYIEDSAEIEKLKINNLRHTILGCMLGDFDEVGAYIVSPEIVRELISMEKYIVETYDNIELCKSALKLDKQISFMVTFEGNRATLSLIEKMNYEANFLLNSGTYSNINEFVLDAVETSGEINRNVLYDRWNIKTMPSQTVDIFNCDDAVLEKFFGIVNRFKYLLHTNKIILKDEHITEEIEAEYANSLFEIIGHYPELSKAVLKTVKETLTEKKGAVSVKKPFFAKTFNEVLENAIQQNKSVLNAEQQKEFETEKRNSIVNLNIKRGDVFDLENVTVDENKNETAPKVVRIATSNVYQSSSIEKLAQEFVDKHREVSARVSADKSNQTETDLFRRTILAVGEKNGKEINLPENANENGEINKLINKISKYGFAGLIDVETKKEETISSNEKENSTKTTLAPEVKDNKKNNNANSGSNVKGTQKKGDGDNGKKKAPKKQQDGQSSKVKKGEENKVQSSTVGIYSTSGSTNSAKEKSTDDKEEDKLNDKQQESILAKKLKRTEIVDVGRSFEEVEKTGKVSLKRDAEEVNNNQIEKNVESENLKPKEKQTEETTLEDLITQALKDKKKTNDDLSVNELINQELIKKNNKSRKNSNNNLSVSDLIKEELDKQNHETHDNGI